MTDYHKHEQKDEEGSGTHHDRLTQASPAVRGPHLLHSELQWKWAGQRFQLESGIRFEGWRRERWKQHLQRGVEAGLRCFVQARRRPEHTDPGVEGQPRGWNFDNLTLGSFGLRSKLGV